MTFLLILKIFKFLVILTTVISPASRCLSSNTVPVTLSTDKAEGYLSSFITQQTGCGNAENPWLLRVGHGQRINITLIDFTSANSEYQSIYHQLCNIYATIKDGNGAVTHTVCGGRGRKVTPVFISVTNNVEVKITSKSNQMKNDGHFLLKYTGM